jgi:hypothetical protein
MPPSIDDEHRRAIAAAAELAYDASRWAVGDSIDLHHILHQLAVDSFLAGFEAARTEAANGR